jgi:hypothetical protein
MTPDRINIAMAASKVLGALAQLEQVQNMLSAANAILEPQARFGLDGSDPTDAELLRLITMSREVEARIRNARQMPVAMALTDDHVGELVRMCGASTLALT